MLGKHTSRHRRSRPSPSPSPSQYGDSTWWDHKGKRPGLHTLARGDRQVLQVDRAHPICSIRSEEVIEFFTDIFYRFGILNAIITDNRSNFIGKKFLRFCDDNNFWIDWVTSSHPRTNG